MQPYSKFKPTALDTTGLSLPDRQGWMVVDVSQTRDSGCLEQSNFASALKMLGGEGDTVEVHRFGHWGPGWFEIILVDPKDEEKMKVAQEIEDSMANYPCLDETDLSQREWGGYEECWSSFGRREYTQAVADAVLETYGGCPRWRFQGFDAEELSEAVHLLTDEEIDGIMEEAAKTVNYRYEHHSDGCYINIKGLVEETDLKDVITVCAKALYAEREVQDIRKLVRYICCVLGIKEMPVTVLERAVAERIKHVPTLTTLIKQAV